MSRISLSPNASGSATFTIAAPATNTDRTLTLPDNTGTVLTNVSSLAAANLTGQVPRANAPSGSVIQVVSATLDTTFSTTSGTYVATGATVNITPSQLTSRLVALAFLPISNSYGSYNVNNYALRLNDVAGPNNTGAGNFQLTTGTGTFVTSLMRIDSPNSVAQQKYDIAIAMSGGTSVSLLAGAQVIVMEIAA